MYMVTEESEGTTEIRGVFADRTKYDNNIQAILDNAALGSTVCAYTGKMNGVLSNNRCVERWKIEIVPEVRQATLQR